MEYQKSLAPIREKVNRSDEDGRDGKRFIKDQGFVELHPVYDITSADIESYLKSLLAHKD